MARYKLRFKKSVAKDLRSIPNKDVQRILKRIAQLADDPRAVGCSKLSGQQYYRVRVAAYRVVYEIMDDLLIIEVIRVDHRARVHR